jgi:V/A-type H+-transporting ATPase subunit K
MSSIKESFKTKFALSLLIPVVLVVVFGTVTAVNTFGQERSAQGEGEVSAVTLELTKERAEVTKFALIAAAVAFGFGAVSAGIGIAYVGSAAMGAIAEKPEVAGQALIFIALAEGLAVFGFITALMILGKV